MADDPTPDPEPMVKPEPEPKPDDALGDGGKKALDAERKRAAAAEKRAKALEAELEAARLESASDQEKAIAAARKEGETEATARANAQIIRSEVKAAAAKKLSDPADAIAALTVGFTADGQHYALADIEVDADGNVDEQAITSAIDALVTTKPYLAAGAKPATGNGDGGAHEPSPDLTIQQRIAEAERAGDWALSKNLKSQLLVERLNT